MECSEARDRMVAYLDEELDKVSLQRLTHHMERCASCKEHLHDLRDVDMLIRGLPWLDIRSDFAEKLGARVKQLGAPSGKLPGRKSMLASVLQLLENLLDLLERNRTPNTRTLDEFGDFPPLSLSCIYFKLMDQPGRG